jgi:hypothetical protein
VFEILFPPFDSFLCPFQQAFVLKVGEEAAE